MPTDKSLVDGLLQAVDGYSDGEAGALVRLSYQTIANYRANAWKRLEYATRRKIIAFLDDPPSAERAEEILTAWRTSTAGAEAAARETIRVAKDRAIEERARNGGAAGTKRAKKK